MGGVCLAIGGCAFLISAALRVYSLLAGALTAAMLAASYLASQLRTTRADLDRARRAKSEFLASVSHELRTPLNGIHGLAELLARDGDTAERQRLAAAIQTSAEALMAAVDEILDLARIERGEMNIAQSPFDVRAAVSEATALLASKAAAKGLKFEIAVAPEVPRVIVGDSLRLREVLRHLLDNAVKFTPSGSVRLEISVGGDPLECRALLFRVCGDCTWDGPPGRSWTGEEACPPQGSVRLGLTLAQQLVGLMGGSIGVESAPGEGAVFWFLLPTAAVEPPPPEDPSPVEDRHARILVVDDNPINQLVAVRALHSLGYAADAVPGGESGLERLSRVHYDAVIMDCQMPGMDGFETSLEIRRREAPYPGRRIPIIAMTANGPGSDRERCLASGMDDYLAKPFRIAELDRALQHWIGERQSIS
jgi:CheY-like chemotaxis protein